MFGRTILSNVADIKNSTVSRTVDTRLDGRDEHRRLWVGSKTLNNVRKTRTPLRTNAICVCIQRSLTFDVVQLS